jgi:hypothetical protein
VNGHPINLRILITGIYHSLKLICLKAIYYIIALSLLSVNLCAQNKKGNNIDSKQFFIDDDLLTARLTINMRQLLARAEKGQDMKAMFSVGLDDSSTVNEEIRVHTRGHFRNDYCYMPPLKLNFHNPGSPRLYPLNNLKLTCNCKLSNYYDQLVLKEYLVYKIYNLLTDKSFRVRLLRLTIEDDKNRKNPVEQYAFFTEDIGAVAKRNHCKELEDVRLNTESTDREHMTLMAIFEYMIGNTDWAIPVNHNTRLLRYKQDSVSKPFAVPYDFDYSGLVNAEYAIPDPELGTQTVLQRVYRGFPRNIGELEKTLKIFIDQKEKIYSLIKGFELLSNRNRDEMIAYLDEFYRDISNQKTIKHIFIDKARIQ